MLIDGLLYLNNFTDLFRSIVLKFRVEVLTIVLNNIKALPKI